MSYDPQYKVKAFRVSPSARRLNVLHVHDGQVDRQGELRLDERQLNRISDFSQAHTLPTEELLLKHPTHRKDREANNSSSGQTQLGFQHHKTRDIPGQALLVASQDELPVVIGTFSEGSSQHPPRTSPSPVVLSHAAARVVVERGQTLPTQTHLNTKKVTSKQPVHTPKRVVELSSSGRFALIAISTIFSIGLTFLFLFLMAPSPS